MGKFGPLCPEKSACTHSFQSCKEIQIEGLINCYRFLSNYQGSVNGMWQKSKKKELYSKYSFKENFIHVSEQKYKKRVDLNQALLAFTF